MSREHLEIGGLYRYTSDDNDQLWETPSGEMYLDGQNELADVLEPNDLVTVIGGCIKDRDYLNYRVVVARTGTVGWLMLMDFGLEQFERIS